MLETESTLVAMEDIVFLFLFFNFLVHFFKYLRCQVLILDAVNKPGGRGTAKKELGKYA